MLKTTIATLVLAFPLSSQARYDFENLNGSDSYPYIALDQQDGWSEETFRANQRCGVTATLSHDGSQSLRFQEVGPGFGCDASRINDASWAYPSLIGLEVAAYFQVDILVGFWGGSFGLAYDTDQSGSIRGAQPGERGVRFDVGTNANVQLRLIAADGTATRVPLAAAGTISGGDWLRVRVVMDLTAGGGTGLGSVEVQNMSAGATALAPVPGLQDVPLALDLTAVNGSNPLLWDAMWLHFEGATYGLDNIEIGRDAARTTTFGAGCAGPSLNLPSIRADGAPTVGNLGFGVGYDNAPTPSMAALFLAFRPTAVPIGRCQLLVRGPIFTLPAVATGTGGSAGILVPVPNDSGVIGLQAYAQWAVLEPGGDVLGLAILSDGLRIVIGT